MYCTIETSPKWNVPILANIRDLTRDATLVGKS